MKAVVIGGGLGGLATALRLRALGWTVTVCEANAAFGGKMNRLRHGPYTFDTGPSLITMPHVFADLFRSIGESIDEHISLVRVDPVAEYRFPCSARVVCPSDTESWRRSIREIEPRDVGGFDRIQALGRKLYELSARTFFRHSPYSRPSFADLSALRFLPFRHAWGNYSKTVATHFRSPLLRRIYDRYATYVGSSPYRCPATLLLIPFLEHEFGAWHVRGGLYSIVESLLRLAAGRDVELMANARVVSIERSGDRVTAVRLESGACLKADVVVMNGDVATAPALLGAPKNIDPGSRSLSGVLLLLAARQRPKGLLHHTVAFSQDYRLEFDELCARRRFPDDPTVYVSAPAATDDSVAPPGCDALFVMANAPADCDEWTTAAMERVSSAVLRRLGAAGIELNGAEVVDVWHPGRFRREYLAPFGSIYGSNSHGWRNAFFRPPNRSRDVRGLYFTGGSTHPGGGTPTVLLSARITTELIAADARA